MYFNPKWLIVSLFFLFSHFAFAKPVLTVYTYDSLATDWGAGPKLKSLFESQCDCELKLMPFENGVTMFNRLRLEGKRTKADVVLGIDQFTMPIAEKSGLFQPHHLNTTSLVLPVEWKNNTFLPFDFGQYAFIYRKDKLPVPPTSLLELVENQDLRIIYQDPRTSTVGRGLLVWLNYAFDETQIARIWQRLSQHTVTVGKGWSETYGAFLKGEADLVLSYTTSPFYHLWNENDDRFRAAPFRDGHLAQIELAAITQTSKQPELAHQFLQFLLQPEAQRVLVKYNLMQPVIPLNDEELSRITPFPAMKFTAPSAETLNNWLATWQKAISR